MTSSVTVSDADRKAADVFLANWHGAFGIRDALAALLALRTAQARLAALDEAANKAQAKMESYGEGAYGLAVKNVVLTLKETPDAK